MTFNSFESSMDLGEPVELYEFTYGDTSESVYRYTTAVRPVTKFGHTFLAQATQRTNYKASGKTEKGSMDIKFPVVSDISSLFSAYPPTQVVRLTVYGGHRNDPDEEFLVLWEGRVLSTAKSETELTLSCESSLISLQRPGLRRNWQYACPFVLYHATTCRANIEAASSDWPVVAITASGGIVLQEGWNGGIDPNKYAGGMLKWRGDTGWEYRTIMRINDDGSFAYAGIIRGLAVGDTVTIIKGCNHQESDCAGIHNNINNYGGQPWIPTTNPVKFPNFW